jgi:hypothetical protein
MSGIDIIRKKHVPEILEILTWQYAVSTHSARRITAPLEDKVAYFPSEVAAVLKYRFKANVKRPNVHSLMNELTKKNLLRKTKKGYKITKRGHNVVEAFFMLDSALNY